MKVRRNLLQRCRVHRLLRLPHRNLVFARRASARVSDLKSSPGSGGRLRTYISSVELARPVRVAFRAKRRPASKARRCPGWFKWRGITSPLTGVYSEVRRAPARTWNPSRCIIRCRFFWRRSPARPRLHGPAHYPHLRTPSNTTTSDPLTAIRHSRFGSLPKAQLSTD